MPHALTSTLQVPRKRPSFGREHAGEGNLRAFCCSAVDLIALEPWCVPCMCMQSCEHVQSCPCVLQLGVWVFCGNKDVNMCRTNPQKHRPHTQRQPQTVCGLLLGSFSTLLRSSSWCSEVQSAQACQGRSRLNSFKFENLACGNRTISVLLFVGVRSRRFSTRDT